MPAAQQRNDELAQLLSADLLSSDDRNVLIESYYSGADVTFTSTVVVPINTTRLNLASDIFSLADNVITVAQAGIYMITGYLRVARSTSIGDNACFFWIDQDPAMGSFVEVPASRGGIHVPNGGTASAEVSVRVRALAGYRYQMRMERDWGSDTLRMLHEGAKLSIVRLFGLR